MADSNKIDCKDGFMYNNKCITKENIDSTEIIDKLDTILESDIINVGDTSSDTSSDTKPINIKSIEWGSDELGNITKDNLIQCSNIGVNKQQPYWEDTFEIEKTDKSLNIKRNDTVSGWGQELKLKCIKNDNFDKIAKCINEYGGYDVINKKCKGCLNKCTGCENECSVSPKYTITNDCQIKPNKEVINNINNCNIDKLLKKYDKSPIQGVDYENVEVTLQNLKNRPDKEDTFEVINPDIVSGEIYNLFKDETYKDKVIWKEVCILDEDKIKNKKCIAPNKDGVRYLKEDECIKNEDYYFDDNQCKLKSEADERVKGAMDAGYRGLQNRTKTSKECQKWTEQTHHKHTRTPQKYPNKGLGNHNYCRNPDGEYNSIWCYTTDKDSRWEPCLTKEAEKCNSENKIYNILKDGKNFECITEKQCKSISKKIIDKGTNRCITEDQCKNNGKYVHNNECHKFGDWKCGIGFNSPMQQLPTGKIACASDNGVDCYSGKPCKETVYPREPIICGSGSHDKIDCNKSKNHWCCTVGKKLCIKKSQFWDKNNRKCITDAKCKEQNKIIENGECTWRYGKYFNYESPGSYLDIHERSQTKLPQGDTTPSYINYSGPQYTKKDNTTLQQCYDLCNNISNCKLFTYNKNENKCFLKYNYDSTYKNFKSVIGTWTYIKTPIT